MNCPCAPAMPARATHQSPSDILIVDDDAAIRAMLHAALTARGYAAQCAANGREALALLERQSFRLLITDV